MSKQQSKITNFFGQNLERPLPFISPDPDRDGAAVAVLETPSQSPGVIVPGTPRTPSQRQGSGIVPETPSLRSQSESPAPVFHRMFEDYQREQRAAQLQPQRVPPLSPTSGTNQDFDAAAQIAADQRLKYDQIADAQRLQDDENAQRRLQDAQAREDASKGHVVITQFKGGRRKSKKSKMAKKSRKTKSKSVKRSHRLKKKLKLKSTRK